MHVSPGASGRVNPLAVQALALTLTQFSGIRSMTLTMPGAPRHRLRSQTGLCWDPRCHPASSTVHPGKKAEEMDVLFDRPVRAASFSLRLASNKELPGKTYTSMFDMTIVLRPREPGVLREGLPLDLTWRVEDRIGRTAEGAKTVSLRLYRSASGGTPE